MPMHLMLEPNPLIGRHFETMISLSLLLESIGLSVTRVVCDGILSANCMSMQYLKYPADNSRRSNNYVCTLCRSKKDASSALMGTSSLIIDSLLDSEDKIFVQSEISRLENDISSTIFFGGLPIHTYAKYETVLRFKEINPVIMWGEETKNFFIETCRNSLYWSIAIEKLVKGGEIHSISVYNGLYSMNRCAIEIAKANRVACVAVHAHDDAKNPYKRLFLNSGNPFFLDALKKWRELGIDSNITKNRLRRYRRKHLEAVRSSKLPWQYSVAANSDSNQINDKINAIRAGFKTCAFIPLSSSDEINAMRASGFAVNNPFVNRPITQGELLSWVLKLSHMNPEILFWIRLHPRMFGNKRDSHNSKEGETLLNYLNAEANYLKNIFIDRGDEHNFFEVLRRSDIVINFLSTIAVEAALLEIPVIAPYCEENFPSYPLDIVSSFYSYEEFIEVFNNNLTKTQSKRLLAEKWIYFSKLECSFSIPTLRTSPTIFIYRVLNYKLSSAILKIITLKIGLLVRSLETKIVQFGKLYPRTNKKLATLLELT